VCGEGNVVIEVVRLEVRDNEGCVGVDMRVC
jgi:hypothetical protein